MIKVSLVITATYVKYILTKRGVAGDATNGTLIRSAYSTFLNKRR